MFLRFFYRARHSLFAVGQNYLRAVSSYEFTSFLAHRIGHCHYKLIAFCRADRRQAYARITRRRLNHRRAFFQRSVSLGG